MGGRANSTTQEGAVRVCVEGVRTVEQGCKGQRDVLAVQVPVSATTKHRIAAENPSSPRRAAHNNESQCKSDNNGAQSKSQASVRLKHKRPPPQPSSQASMRLKHNLRDHLNLNLHAADAYSQPRGNAILASLGRDVTRETLAR